MEWRRFELITNDVDQIARFENVLEEKHLTRQDLALILFSLRVRPGFNPSDFGIQRRKGKRVVALRKPYQRQYTLVDLDGFLDILKEV